MNRRQFLKDVALWCGGLTLSIPCVKISEAAPPPEKNPSVLSIGRGEDYMALTAKVLEPLGSMSAFVKSGDKVVIKPNIGWDRNPMEAANTHPLVVKSLVLLALDAGAGEVKVFDRTCNEERRCYTNSGIKDAIESIKDKRVKFFHPDPRKYVPIRVERGKAVSQLEIYRDALEADTYINVPIAKHHGLSTLTLGIKNSMGVLGGKRGKMHQNLGQKLADLATVIQPKLTVIDATRILLRNGPQGGNLKDVKILDTIIASTDPVAADARATTLFGLRPEEIESTVAAFKMGLGEIDLDRIKMVQV